MAYIYNDEDNAPMNDDQFDRIDQNGHNPTVYLSEYEARMYDKYGEPEPHKKPSDGCWNCMNFNWKHEACTLNWNNMDESYYNPDIDDRELTYCCEYHEEDPDVDPADCFDFGGNEP